MKGHWCRCCGLGLAFANFSGVHSHWNFYSVHVHVDWAEDDEGWLISSPQRFAGGVDVGSSGAFAHSPWLQISQPLPISADLVQFAYKVDDSLKIVQIRLRMGMQAGISWTWELEYHLTYQDYDELIAKGRLRLNDYEVSATHSGNTTVQSYISAVATNNQDGWGDIMLVYPKFGEDWTGKKLVVTASTATPVKNTNSSSSLFSYGVFENVPIDLSWLVGTNYEFVFDDDTFVELPTNDPPYRPRYYEINLTGSGYKFFKARHYSLVDDISNIIGPTTPPEAYPQTALELSFDVQAKGARAQSAEDVSMRWQISHIWWKAFENNGVVVTTEHKNPATANNGGVQAPVATPVLFTRTLANQRWGLTEFDQLDQSASIFPITYTLSVLDLP